MPTNPPRAVLVTRETEYQLLIARHATRDQARFFLATRGQDIAAVEQRHERFLSVLQAVRAAVPDAWRQAVVDRRDFDRFLFGPEDVVVAVGQDGLVANVAKYLAGQPVIGVNPDPALYDGLLVRFAPGEVAPALARIGAGDCAVESLTMAEARLEDGSHILALNEVFVGHRSHQSARYEIAAAGGTELQSSSGVIVATGTGATGWARSIMEATGTQVALARTDTALGFFVREPFPSVATGTSLRSGRIEPPEQLIVTSRMNDGGVIFADGIEQHFLPFDWGRRVEVGVAAEALRLVVA